MRAWLLAVLMSAPAATAVAQGAPPCGRDLLAVIEPDARVSAGSKAALLQEARKGTPLRVGWEIGRPGEPPIVAHWQDALFVTVFENEVFTQLGGLHRQQPQIGQAHIALVGQDQVWRSSLGTNGRLITKMTGEEKVLDQKVRAYWCRAAR